MKAPDKDRPYYLARADEEALFKAAYAEQLPILLKGPTGCGKTRFVEAMAFDIGRPLVTVACHDDLGAADLVGRFLLEGDNTVWHDGPLTRAVRNGALCYLDEVIEARADTLVVLHPLTDHRRTLPIERINESLQAPAEFALIVSYNPGYQSVLKDLKPSTRQRMVAIDFDYPQADHEIAIVQTEASVDGDIAERLVALAGAIRAQEDVELREVASTRALIATARLLRRGIAAQSAIRAGMVSPLTDDRRVVDGLLQLAAALFGSR
jgi:nitric oxide reductase NorQ protein